MSDKGYKRIRYGVLFIALVLLCLLFPYSGDDWAWGSQIGIDRLKSGFDNYNGRYLGNIFVLIMTRSNLLKALIMSAGLVVIAWCSEKIFQTKWAFYLTCVTFALIPKLLLRQAVVWTSGYSNYVIALIFVLLYIVYVYPIFDGKMPQKKYLQCIPLLLLGLCSALIMEHVTIYSCVLGVAVIVYTIVAYKKVFMQHVAFLVGSIAGAIIMFSNAAYHTIAQNEDNYRQVASGGAVHTAFNNFVKVITKHLCFNNLWINIALVVVGAVLLCQLKDSFQKKITAVIVKLSYSGMFGYTVWSFLSIVGNAGYIKPKRLVYFEALLTVMYVLAVLVFTAIIGYHKKCVWKMLFWNASILCLTLPLLVVNPIGERCFFPTYIIYAMLLMELCSQLECKEKLNAKVVRRVCTLVSVISFLFYVNVYGMITQVSNDRLEHVKKDIAQGKTTIKIIHLPYESYVWTGTPEQAVWEERYKLFYNLPLEVNLVDVGSNKKN